MENMKEETAARSTRLYVTNKAEAACCFELDPDAFNALD
jgi:hypothetical protein